MNSIAYTKYYSMLDSKSAWLWGIDVSLYKFGITTGIIDTMIATHHIHHKSYSKAGAPNATNELNYNLNRFNMQFSIGTLISTIFINT